jgi:hypothetical protein
MLTEDVRPAERLEIFRWNVCCIVVGDVLCVSQTRGLKLVRKSLSPLLAKSTDVPTRVRRLLLWLTIFYAKPRVRVLLLGIRCLILWCSIIFKSLLSTEFSPAFTVACLLRELNTGRM